MKIVHIAIEAPYNEGWGYQENLLPKYQVKLNHQVTLVTTTKQNLSNNQTEKVESGVYESPDGFKVVRLNNLQYFPRFVADKVKLFSIYDVLKEEQPDLIMVHGLENFSVLQINKYLKKDNPRCKVIADNHLDYNIGKSFLRKDIAMRIFVAAVRLLNKKMQKHYEKVYGVTPWRCEFAHEILGIDKNKLDVFPAGADDEHINYENRERIKNEIRKKHGVSDNEFLIVTGGKIDADKNIHILMEAVANLDFENIKLLVFGTPSPDIEEKFNKLSQNGKIISIGWIPAKETYNYFLAADLVFFPGQHSVMWEQVVACGTPIVMKHYKSMHHCDVGGNAKFLYEDSVEGISKLLTELLTEEKLYRDMLDVARSEKRKQFLYSELAKKSIEVMEWSD
ncbi:MAG: glycosyltransferase family 4 protein [Ruminococcaceae bacterium]|nr:glycosyltransferase family 4 protein [Oscillospiraceae bacterium]